MNDDGLVVNKNQNQIYIIGEPNNKPLKIVWEEYPCPKDATHRCKHSKFLSKEDTISIFCDLVKCVKA